jgi:hypothetical protein
MFRGLDAMAGAPVGLVAGAFNQHLRRKHAQGITGFLGDVFVYQRNHRAIHRRVMETLAERAPGYGTRERPIPVLAHSLGGVIAFDLATRPIEPLWVDTLVTFGSQPSFFHVFDPRPGLDPYAPGSPVRLPQTVRQWVNLWEPLDPLAFAAGRVFVLDSGLAPKDVHTPHAASFGLWTHDDYWGSTRLTDTIRDVLDG